MTLMSVPPSWRGQPVCPAFTAEGIICAEPVDEPNQLCDWHRRKDFPAKRGLGADSTMKGAV